VKATNRPAGPTTGAPDQSLAAAPALSTLAWGGGGAAPPPPTLAGGVALRATSLRGP
jgi:hypothetical protein